VIRSFRCRDTERLFYDEFVARFHAFERAARRKLLFLNAARRLEDLLVPPGNRLEKLKGDRAGRFSIRINDQWRVSFRWWNGGAFDVEIVDYH
jgi:proteic killer suppression protein